MGTIRTGMSWEGPRVSEQLLHEEHLGIDWAPNWGEVKVNLRESLGQVSESSQG